jgi:integrase
MAVRKINRRGSPVLFIDIRYKKKDGTRARFRKDAQVQTLAAARAEEKRYLLHIAQHGEPFEPEPPAPIKADSPKPDSSPASASPPSAKTFADVATEFRSTYMITDLKVTTRRGYTQVLDSTLLPRFGDRPIDHIDGLAASELDLDLSKRGLTKGTRNNIQIVLRSILRFAKERKHLSAPPSGLPRIKQPDKTILEIPSDDQVDRILGAACPSHRCTFALMAYAGLRPNEVRALRRRDVRLHFEDREAIGGFLSIREGRSHGELHTPKTGQREIPIAPQLARLLAPTEKAARDEHVALNEHGKPWGQYGIDQAFGRVRRRAGLDGWSVYCLRHYAITSWLRAGVPVHVVQRMAGHKHLSTTQRYVHHLKQDLEEAARRLVVFNRGNGRGNSSGDCGATG